LRAHEIDIPGSEQDQHLPFINAKYRANVRIVDYWPHKLEDFAVGRRKSEFEIISDYSGGESTDNEEDMRLFRSGKGFGGEKIWEWRFALQVEEAGEKGSEKIWLIVNNEDGQMLLDQDAAK
jgi:protection-of-telomeres protein 1